MQATVDLKSRIQREYERLGYSLGWKLLYSAEEVVQGARVAFIGLNPGGNGDQGLVADFAPPYGSAYVDEIWEGQSAPGQSRLQTQVRALFKLIDESPDRVLAGNLVPFRSPSWSALPRRQEAMRFGTAIWRDLLAWAKPELVIGMGSEVWGPLKQILQVGGTSRVPVGWGSINGERAKWPGGSFVGLPHLSRFAIVTRPESKPGLTELFGL